MREFSKLLQHKRAQTSSLNHPPPPMSFSIVVLSGYKRALRKPNSGRRVYDTASKFVRCRLDADAHEWLEGAYMEGVRVKGEPFHQRMALMEGKEVVFAIQYVLTVRRTLAEPISAPFPTHPIPTRPSILRSSSSSTTNYSRRCTSRKTKRRNRSSSSTPTRSNLMPLSTTL